MNDNTSNEQSTNQYKHIKTSRGYSVLEQNVFLNFSILFSLFFILLAMSPNHEIEGYTEIVLLPHTANLNLLRLNSRSCEILSVRLNDVFSLFLPHSY